MQKKRIWRPGFSLALLAALMISFPVWVLAQRGALTVSQNLEELVGEAGTIVEGYVQSWHVEPHPELTKLNTLVVRFRVTNALKGGAGSTLTFRQYLWDFRDEQNGAGHKKGQQVLLMLVPVSAYGLTSPVGMAQGRFRITRDAEGKEFAVNGNGNTTLFRGLSSTASSKFSKQPGFARYLEEGVRGPIPLQDLRDMIGALAGETTGVTK